MGTSVLMSCSRLCVRGRKGEGWFEDKRYESGTRTPTGNPRPWRTLKLCRCLFDLRDRDCSDCSCKSLTKQALCLCIAPVFPREGQGWGPICRNLCLQVKFLWWQTCLCAWLTQCVRSRKIEEPSYFTLFHCYNDMAYAQSFMHNKHFLLTVLGQSARFGVVRACSSQVVPSDALT